MGHPMQICTSNKEGIRYKMGSLLHLLRSLFEMESNDFINEGMNANEYFTFSEV